MDRNRCGQTKSKSRNSRKMRCCSMPKCALSNIITFHKARYSGVQVREPPLMSALRSRLHRWANIEQEEGITMRKLRLIRSLLFTLVLMCLSAATFAQIGVSVSFGPPALPVYEQPICPGDGYIWTPGYWAWDGGDYYWVPGTWVLGPEVGYLWTPPWWGWDSGVFLFHEGFWGPHIGFYGGINYGFGYFGV